MTFSSYQTNWSWDYETEKWLEAFCKNKNVLNFPCGSSKIGTVRADADPRIKPDVVCTFENHQFAEKSFDLVIFDPPFRFQQIQHLRVQIRN